MCMAITHLYVMEGEDAEGQWEDLGLVEGGVAGVGNGWKSARINPDPLDPLYSASSQLFRHCHG